MKSIGAGLFAWPHGFDVDDEGNIMTPVPEYLDGDAMKQMEAVAIYLSRYGS